MISFHCSSRNQSAVFSCRYNNSIVNFVGIEDSSGCTDKFNPLSRPRTNEIEEYDVMQGGDMCNQWYNLSIMNISQRNGSQYRCSGYIGSGMRVYTDSLKLQLHGEHCECYIHSVRCNLATHLLLYVIN